VVCVFGIFGKVGVEKMKGSVLGSPIVHTPVPEAIACVECGLENRNPVFNFEGRRGG